ncbi:hypothetical protein OIU84_020267 [Salix udensis]|uniref:Uncharacterized protein n=1 Tax=Salix udensis TaxID=889485 RepID=A0AAD6J7W7_9ROSI|nr:hypothetical protein OIU84_020267 [Salix udensis]
MQQLLQSLLLLRSASPGVAAFLGPPFFSSGPLSVFLPGSRLVSPGPPWRLLGLLLGLLAFRLGLSLGLLAFRLGLSLGLLAFRLGFCLVSPAVGLGSFLGLFAVSLGPPRRALGLPSAWARPGSARGLGSFFEPVVLLRPAGLAFSVLGPGPPPLLPRASP